MEIRTDECPCTLNETELFDPVPKQIVLCETREETSEPVGSLDNDVIEFKIDGTNDFIEIHSVR